MIIVKILLALVGIAFLIAIIGFICTIIEAIIGPDF